MKSIIKTKTKVVATTTRIKKITKEQIVLNTISVTVLVCIIDNPNISGQKISKKTRIPPASVYRTVSALTDAGFLDTITQRPGRYGGNSTIMFTSKKKQFKLIIDSKGVRMINTV